MKITKTSAVKEFKHFHTAVYSLEVGDVLGVVGETEEIKVELKAMGMPFDGGTFLWTCCSFKMTLSVIPLSKDHVSMTLVRES